MIRSSRFGRQRRQQQGAALFVALFLITATAAVAAVVALTTGTQQLGSARALDAEKAYYAAVGRLESELPAVISSQSCPGGGTATIAGFSTEVQCDSVAVEEGGSSYVVITLEATAVRGSQTAGTLVRRTAQTQVTTSPED